MLGIALMVGGVVRIFLAWSMREAGKPWGWVVVSGIISLLLGLMIIAKWPYSSFYVLGIFLGIDLIFIGSRLAHDRAGAEAAGGPTCLRYDGERPLAVRKSLLAGSARYSSGAHAALWIHEECATEWRAPSKESVSGALSPIAETLVAKTLVTVSGGLRRSPRAVADAPSALTPDRARPLPNRRRRSPAPGRREGVSAVSGKRSGQSGALSPGGRSSVAHMSGHEVGVASASAFACQ